MTILDKFRTQTLAAELRITEERAKDLQTNEHEVIRISELERLLKYTPFGGKKEPLSAHRKSTKGDCVKFPTSR